MTHATFTVGYYSYRVEIATGRVHRNGVELIEAPAKPSPLGAPELGDVARRMPATGSCEHEHYGPAPKTLPVHDGGPTAEDVVKAGGPVEQLKTEVSALISECHMLGSGQRPEVALKFARAARALLENESDRQRVEKARRKLDAARRVLEGNE